jgi:hypothetical protein
MALSTRSPSITGQDVDKLGQLLSSTLGRGSSGVALGALVTVRKGLMLSPHCCQGHCLLSGLPKGFWGPLEAPPALLRPELGLLLNKVGNQHAGWQSRSGMLRPQVWAPVSEALGSELAETASLPPP